MAQRENLVQIAENVAVAEGVELYWLKYQNAPNAQRLQVFIDKDGGVSLDDCERFSRALETLFEEEIHHPFELEVSSPGIERPLYTADHYRKAAGQNIRVKTFGPIEGNRIWDGKLLEAGEVSISLETSNGSQEIELEQIAQAQVSPDFDLS